MTRGRYEKNTFRERITFCNVFGTGPDGWPYTTADVPISVWTTRTLNLTAARAANYTVTPVLQTFQCAGVCHSNAACDTDPALIGCGD